MKFFNRRAVFMRKDDYIALDFDGKRHYYQLQHIEFAMFDFQANDGLAIADTVTTPPEIIDELVPKYHNVLADVIVGVRPTPTDVVVGAVTVVQNKSTRIFIHEPEAQPRRYTPFGRNEAFIGDHQSSPYDDPDGAFARFWLMHNDEPALIFDNQTGLFDPPSTNIPLQIVRFYFAQYVLSAECAEKPAVFTPIPYIRTTIADFTTREMKPGCPIP